MLKDKIRTVSELSVISCETEIRVKLTNKKRNNINVLGFISSVDLLSILPVWRSRSYPISAHAMARKLIGIFKYQIFGNLFRLLIADSTMNTI